MERTDFKITAYKNSLKTQITKVWEESVCATHSFLKPTDFEDIKRLVTEMDFSVFSVYCLLHKKRVIGFIGVTGEKVEMLFLSPKYFRLGLGKKLMTFAFTELGANKVDVNEQNTGAITFYKKLGFEVYDRSEKDEQGKDYPILKMKLESPNF